MLVGKKRSLSTTSSDACALHKEWDEALCPICMDHPHNAVLLLCSSYGKGCRPYICDTSYRHSNCLDRYQKTKVNSGDNPSSTGSTAPHPQSSSNTSSSSRSAFAVRSESVHILGNHNQSNEYGPVNVDSGLDQDGHEMGVLQPMKLNLNCPLCRGEVHSWKVVKEAREYLNLKSRSCTRESCTFVGNYRDLRRHARNIHPSERPAEIDPSRQQAWRRLEHQREYNDIISAIQSAIPGAIVFGDYVIENGNDNTNWNAPTDRGRGPGELNGSLWSTFFLFRMLRSMDSIGERRSRSRGSWSRHRRLSGSWTRRRQLWGENFSGVRDDEAGINEGNNGLSAVNRTDSNIPRRRRRLNRPRSNSHAEREPW